jgi:hypothetical protein
MTFIRVYAVLADVIFGSSADTGCMYSENQHWLAVSRILILE